MTLQNTQQNSLHPIKFLIAGLFFLAMVIAGMFAKGAGNILLQVIHLPSLIAVYLMPLPVLWIAFPIPIWKKTASLVFQNSSHPPGLALIAAAFLRFWTAAALVCGTLVTVVGIIRVLSVLDQPEFTGPGIAVSLLGIFHGLIFAMCFGIPLYKISQKKIQFQTKSDDAALMEYRQYFERGFRKLRLLVGSLLFMGFFILMAIINRAGDLLAPLIDPGTIIIFLGCILAAAIVLGGKNIPSAFHTFVFKDFSERGNKAVLRKIEAMQFSAVGAGFLGTAIGIIKVMTVLDQPDFIGPGMTVSLFSTVYGILGLLFFGAISKYYALRSNIIGGPELKLVTLLLASIFVVLFACFAVLTTLTGW